MHKSIVVAVNDHPSVQKVVEKANVLAAKSAAQLALVSVVEESYLVGSTSLYAFDPTPSLMEVLLDETTKLHTRLKKAFSLHDDQMHILNGSVAHELSQFVKAENADLLVIGLHKRHGLDYVFGSNSSRILHLSQSDVLAVKTDTENSSNTYEKILVAVDFSDEMTAVLERALLLASLYECDIELLHVIDERMLQHLPIDFDKSDIVDQVSQRLSELKQEADYTKITTHSMVGQPASAVCDYAREQGCDLIVVGSHGRHGLNLMLGSVASGIFNRAESDVYSVRVDTANA